MSHTRCLIAVDASTMTAVVRAHRRATAEGSGAVISPTALSALELRRLCEAARIPTDTRGRARHERQLAKWLELGAPEIVVREARLGADPRGFLSSCLARGELPSEHEFAPLFERKRLALGEPFWWARWLADATYRRVTDEADTYPFITSAGSTASVDAHLFGSLDIEVDGRALEQYRVEWRGPNQPKRCSSEQAAEVAHFYESVSEAAAPSVKTFTRWFRQLHASRFTLVPDEVVPKGRALDAHYRHFLKVTRAFATRASAFYAQAHKRGFDVIVYLE